MKTLDDYVREDREKRASNSEKYCAVRGNYAPQELVVKTTGQILRECPGRAEYFFFECGLDDTLEGQEEGE